MRRLRLVVLVPAVVAVLAGTSCSDGGNSGDGSPIKVGAVSSLTGAISFPEASAAAKAVFDRFNSQGGSNGRKIEYRVEDDKADPQLAVQAARRLVDEFGAFVNVGSASLLECSANAKFYESKNFRSIQGTGVDPVCFNSPAISPVNTGPYTGLTVALYYASEVLKRDKVCLIYFNLPGLQEPLQAAIDRWKKITNKQLTLQDVTMQLTDDPTPFVIKAKQAGCQAVTVSGLEPQALAWAKAAKTQDLQADLIGLSSVYTDRVAAGIADTGFDKYYVNAEFEPYDSKNPELDDWRNLMTSAKVPLTAFAEGGYVAAMAFLAALKTVQGTVTRESITKALEGFTEYKTALMGTPYSFGPGNAHNPNQASKFVKAEGGKWVTVTPDWIKLPSA